MKLKIYTAKDSPFMVNNHDRETLAKERHGRQVDVYVVAPSKARAAAVLSSLGYHCGPQHLSLGMGNKMRALMDADILHTDERRTEGSEASIVLVNLDPPYTVARVHRGTDGTRHSYRLGTIVPVTRNPYEFVRDQS